MVQDGYGISRTSINIHFLGNRKAFKKRKKNLVILLKEIFLEVLFNISTYISLVRIESHGCFQLQRKLGKVVM